MLSPQQYGYRFKHLPELAALNLVDKSTYTLDRGVIPMNIIDILTYLRPFIP